MKSTLLPALLAGTLCLSGAAQAAFTDSYAVGNWTTTISGGDGSVDTSGAPDSVSLTSANDGSGFFESVDFTIAAAAGGTVSFGWDYLTTDVEGAAFDPFGYLLNGVFTLLTADDGDLAQSGLVSFAVAAGDVFGFRISAIDSDFGAATATVSEFSGPEQVASVPEPASLALLGIGLVGLGALHRRHHRAD